MVGGYQEPWGLGEDGYWWLLVATGGVAGRRNGAQRCSSTEASDWQMQIALLAWSTREARQVKHANMWRGTRSQYRTASP